MSFGRVWILAFLALALVGTTWALLVPIGGQPDEPAHMVKVAAVARGELTWDSRHDIVSRDSAVLTHSEVEMRAPRGYVDLGTRAACLAARPRLPASCAPPLDESTDTVDDASSYVAAYPPLPYALMGIPSRFVGPTHGVYGARLIMVLLCSSLLAAAFAVASTVRRRPWLLVGVTLSATPMALYLQSAPNPSGLEIAAAICFGASLLVLVVPPELGAGPPEPGEDPGEDPGDEPGGAPPRAAVLVTAVISGVVLANARPVSLAVMGFAAIWVLLTFGTPSRLLALLRVRAVQIGAAVVGVASILGAAWFVYAKPLDMVVGIPFMGYDTTSNIRYSLDQLPYRGEELIGRFGRGDTDPASWVQYGWLALVGVLVIVAIIVGSWRQRFALVALVGAVVILPTVAEIPRVNELGFIWYGRYWIAFAVTVPLIAGAVIATSTRVTNPVRALHRFRSRLTEPSTVRWVAIPLTLFIAACQFVSMSTVASRYAVGETTDLFAFLDDQVWSPQIGATGSLLLIIAATLAYSGVVAWMLRHTPDRPTTDDDQPTTDDRPSELAGSLRHR